MCGVCFVCAGVKTMWDLTALNEVCDMHQRMCLLLLLVLENGAWQWDAPPCQARGGDHIDQLAAAPHPAAGGCASCPLNKLTTQRHSGAAASHANGKEASKQNPATHRGPDPERVAKVDVCELASACVDEDVGQVAVTHAKQPARDGG